MVGIARVARAFGTGKVSKSSLFSFILTRFLHRMEGGPGLPCVMRQMIPFRRSSNNPIFLFRVPFPVPGRYLPGSSSIPFSEGVSHPFRYFLFSSKHIQIPRGKRRDYRFLPDGRDNPDSAHPMGSISRGTQLPSAKPRPPSGPTTHPCSKREKYRLSSVTPSFNPANSTGSRDWKRRSKFCFTFPFSWARKVRPASVRCTRTSFRLC